LFCAYYLNYITQKNGMDIMTESTEEKMPDTQEALNENDDVKTVESEQTSEDSSVESGKQEAQPELSDKEKIEKLEKENAELKDQLLRRAADFDNYRKRVIKEKAEAVEYANSNLLADLLESLDNFDRTVDAAATATDAKSIADGIKMINNTLVAMLETKYGLTSFGKPGEPFCPEEHEALRSEEGDVTEPVLKEIYLKGYKLKDRIIRHAKVTVTMPESSKK
ncbi:MAG: nucleotide exchange factor GrpE, partial [Treponema sp.]